MSTIVPAGIFTATGRLPSTLLAAAWSCDCWIVFAATKAMEGKHCSREKVSKSEIKLRICLVHSAKWNSTEGSEGNLNAATHGNEVSTIRGSGWVVVSTERGQVRTPTRYRGWY